MKPLSLRLTHRLRRFLLLAALIIPAVAGASSAQAAPASESEMSLYTRIAAVNVCISRGAGVEFDKAANIAGETIAQLIKGQHDGQIKQVGAKALTIEELRRGSVNSAVIGAVELCPKEVPADVVKKVNDALKQQGGK
ncbi:MAG: cAMP phosphodiesterase [Cyanobium sp. CZS 48M]|nr:cAMP phosphodiesterase [Cyanobium sp. CZS48M]